MRQRPRARRGEGRNPFTLQNGYAIRTIREMRRWSVTALAREVGISQSTLSNIEAERRSTDDEVLDRIADVLDVDVEAIRRERTDLSAKSQHKPRLTGRDWRRSARDSVAEAVA